MAVDFFYLFTLIMTQTFNKKLNNFFNLLTESFKNHDHNFTEGSIPKGIFLLAIPMILEMVFESVFALVDIYFVSRLGKDAISTVGLTESMLTIIYSLAFGVGMSATAMVARRVGENNNEAASKTAAQTIILGIVLSIGIAIVGYFFAKPLLGLMGATKNVMEYGSNYTTILLVGNGVILFIHLLNGIFRGAGNAAISMRSLLLANILNIILCPICIHFWGITGAAIATTTGRGVGVLYQLYHLKNGTGIIKIKASYFTPNTQILQILGKLSFTNTMQFIITSASWVAMVRIISMFGTEAVSGYTIAIRLLIFFIMPAFGLSNTAAALVGQNLGANKPDRAETAVWKVAKYNAIFMAFVTVLFVTTGKYFVAFFTKEQALIEVGSLALTIISSGYIFYGVGMVLMNAFNGAGDSKTPTLVNLFWYWLIQIPLGWVLAKTCNLQIAGVCLAIVSIEAFITITYYIIFKKGKWKLTQV